jgi:hypothetical protein
MRNSSRKREKQQKRRSQVHGERTVGTRGQSNPRKEAATHTQTAGECFLNATIDLVADPADSHKLNLLLCNGSTSKVAPQIEHGRSLYKPDQTGLIIYTGHSMAATSCSIWIDKGIV